MLRVGLVEGALAMPPLDVARRPVEGVCVGRVECCALVLRRECSPVSLGDVRQRRWGFRAGLVECCGLVWVRVAGGGGEFVGGGLA